MIALRSGAEFFKKSKLSPPPEKKIFQKFPQAVLSSVFSDPLYLNIKYKLKNMATFYFVRYCSYNIRILSSCSFLKRFKTTEPGETNLNRRKESSNQGRPEVAKIGGGGSSPLSGIRDTPGSDRCTIITWCEAWLLWDPKKIS